MKDFLFSSESVTEGHPDKVCDQISDSVLDAILAQDPLARVACETACNTGLVLVMGEITTSCYVDIPSITRKTVLDIGYNSSQVGFDGNTCSVLTSIDEQSRDIALGVDHSIEDKAGDGYENGAGDQGMMFGFASSETEQYMPLPIEMAHKLTQKLSQVRKSGQLPWVRPDGKSQVSVRYENGKPVSIDTVVVSTQHSPDVSIETLREAIIEEVVKPMIPAHLIKNTQFLINPTGRFVIGGPVGDSGLTGRKIIVDTYGGYARHGGGAFSGKDPTKVDRSAAYAARWVAKHVVAAGLADKCELELAYAIGVAHPVSLLVETFGTAKVDEAKLQAAISHVFDLKPTAIIDALELRNPIYKQTAAYGHFGRSDLDLPWERLSRIDELIEAVKG